MMRKCVCTMLMICLMMIFGCSSMENTVQNGTYSATDGTAATLELNQDTNEFTFHYISYMSYIPTGTYICEDGRLIATVSAEEIYVFEIVDGQTLSFVSAESSGYASHIWNGTIFKLTE